MNFVNTKLHIKYKIMKQDIKCFFGLHKYEVYKEEDVLDGRKEICSKAIINRCSNCGKLKVTYVPLTKTI